MTSAVDDLPATAERLVTDTDHLYASPRWLDVERAVATDDPLHVGAEGGDGGAAFAACYRFDTRSNPWPIARLDLFLQARCTDLGVELPADDLGSVLPCYLVGGRRPGHSRILTSGPPAGRGELLRRVLTEVIVRATERGAATVAALYCDDDDAELAAAFRDAGGTRIPSHATYVLELPGDRYEDWLASLPRKQRQNETADARKLAGVDFSVDRLQDVDLDRIVDLEMGNYHKYGNDYRLAEARALHEAYLEHLGDDAMVITASRAGETVGFASLVRHGTSVFLRQGGFDEARCDGAPVYFGAVFHTAVRWAYEAGVRTLDYSISAGGVKVRRGCHELRRSAWVVPLSDDARRLVSRVAGAVDAI